jgi:hypothetical protein
MANLLSATELFHPLHCARVSAVFFVVARFRRFTCFSTPTRFEVNQVCSLLTAREMCFTQAYVWFSTTRAGLLVDMVAMFILAVGCAAGACIQKRKVNIL